MLGLKTALINYIFITLLYIRYGKDAIMPNKKSPKRAYVIRMSSQKGGVGKTTVAVNLSTALSIAGYKVLLVDSDISNPSITFYLGLRKPNVGFNDVLLGKSKLENADVLYPPTGMRVLPEPATDEEVPPIKEEYFDAFGQQLHKSDFHFIIIDTSPGIMSEKLLYYDEALLVTTPEMPALSSVVKLGKLFSKNKVNHNLVVNRFNKNIDIDDVKDLYGKQPIAVLPEDDIVAESLAKQVPAYLVNKTSPFPTQIGNLLNYYTKLR
jgi:MinD-like ATPase involved in chromosome partitioning or flagellar assembly